MRITTFPVVVLLLMVRTCRAKIVVATSTPDESTSSLIEDLINIVTSCYGDRINPIGLAGRLPDALSRTLTAQHLIPVALIDNDINDTTKYRANRTLAPVKFRHKLHVFIVEASSRRQLGNIIENIASTIWWNHMASFFILDDSAGCRNARNFLFVAWQRDLLNAKVMCYRRKSGGIIVSYNPFTSQAPSPWQQVGVFRRKMGHPFTLFSREYREMEEICAELDFDKTKDLGGSEVALIGPMRRNFVYAKHNASTYGYVMKVRRIVDNVLWALHATPNFTIEDFETSSPLTHDIKVDAGWMEYSWDNIIVTYPYEQTGLVLISHFRGHKSQLSKILSVIDVNSRFGMGIVYLITLLFFKFFVGQALVPAFLNIIRITCNTGFANLPDNIAPRIYLACLLFFAVTMQGIFQGNLASLLTKQIPLKNIDTAKDLVDFNYKVFGVVTEDVMIDYPDISKRYTFLDEPDDCVLEANHDSSAACLDFGDGAGLDAAREFNMHVSSEFVIPTYITFEIRWDWPLEERVNVILSTMVEADMLQPWDVKCNPTKLIDFKFDAEVKRNKDFRKMKLSDLAFAFVILSIGLGCATIVFIAELAVHRYKSRIVNVRVQILN